MKMMRGLGTSLIGKAESWNSSVWRMLQGRPYGNLSVPKECFMKAGEGLSQCLGQGELF